jgi:hypothetical protein
VGETVGVHGINMRRLLGYRLLRDRWCLGAGRAKLVPDGRRIAKSPFKDSKPLNGSVCPVTTTMDGPMHKKRRIESPGEFGMGILTDSQC